MVQTISRMYPTREQAEKALAELRGFSYYGDSHLFAGTDPATGAEVPDAVLTDRMAKAMILRDHARIFTAGLRKGGTLVSVHAPFATGLQAMQILDAHGPIESGVPDIAYPVHLWNERTPVSSTLRMPTLTKTRLPFAAFTGLPTLSTGRRLKTGMLMPMLSRTRWFTGVMPLLTRTRTPLSSLFHLPLLSKKRYMLKNA